MKGYGEVSDIVTQIDKELGDKKMSFVMAMLMLPWLMEQMRDTDSFKQHMKARERKLN